MSTVKSKKLQVGTDATSSNNFTIYQPSIPDGTLRIGHGSADNPTEVAQFHSSGITMASGTSIIANGSDIAAGSIDVSRMPSGSILQVQYHDVTANYTGTGNTNRDFPAWSFSFTPKRSDSKVLLVAIAGLNLICDGRIYLKRNGTIIKDGWFSSTRVDNQHDYEYASGSYLDSPATTSAITYQLGGRATGCGQTIRFGSTEGSASLTIMEVAG